VHRKRRAANAPLFSKRAILSDGQSLIQHHLKQLVGVFENSMASGKPIDLNTTMLAFTTDILYQYAFEHNSGLMSDPDAADRWRSSMQSVAAAIPLVKHFPWIPDIVKSFPEALLAPIVPEVTGLVEAQKVGPQ
jgi:hypothetical protein